MTTRPPLTEAEKRIWRSGVRQVRPIPSSLATWAVP